MQTIECSDGASIVLHDMAGQPAAPTLLISHATGFHSYCYLPIAEALEEGFHSFGIDHRGHGASAVPPGWRVNWDQFGTDAESAAKVISSPDGLVGFGHSMGGAALLSAAYASPSQFARLVLFEPIVHPAGRISSLFESNPLVAGARRRRRNFDSYDQAITNYSGKPPLSIMQPESLRLYVEHGFKPDQDDVGIELCCSPEFEAEVFIGTAEFDFWDQLESVEVPTLVVSGKVEPDQPSGLTEEIADRLPNGTYLRLPHQTHFGPFSHPHEIAELIAGD